MASTYAKRLAKLEELLATKINQPLAYLWLENGETKEQACIRAGYDPSQASRLFFVRWMTEAEAGMAPPVHHPLDPVVKPGPPKEETTQSPIPDPGKVTETSSPDPRPTMSETALDPLDEDIDRRAARRLQTEKLFEATKAFAKTIV